MTVPRNEVLLNAPLTPLWPGHDREIALAARTDACILLSGPPEAAREVAHYLHLSSGWRFGPFTVVDCASRDPALEVRLLDAVFPGAAAPRPGAPHARLMQAGTVLLQEINRLPLHAQGRLAARLLEVHPKADRLRRRLIASSSEPLFERVLNGTFDDSLYYRLNVMQFAAARPEGPGGPPRIGD